MAKRRRRSIYGWAINAIFPVAIAGMGVLAFGMARDVDAATRIGTALFIGSIGLWGGANGGGMLYAARVSHRRFGWQPWRAHFWSSLLFLGLTLFFLGVSVWAAWMIGRLLMSPTGF